MYIQEIAIDGFKSYASRVGLQHFDPCFNAITGLNGTGKSNILDSICFVLGLKNLAQVRATNLQELVYKQGQAGISKATVSITFRNNNKETSPQGYEDKDTITVTRTIVVGGRNKYLINGLAAQENRVADFFQSVQLNINNPHFLIMQGRITKVLNMKPPEILGLLEEACGTKMYERKKDAAEKTLEQKQKRLQEIDQVLAEQIKPSLDTFRKGVAEYEEWVKLSTKVDSLGRFIVAFDYTTCAKSAGKHRDEIAAYASMVSGRDGRKAQLVAAVQEKAAEIDALHTEKAIQAGGEAKELQAAADELQLRLSKDKTSLKHKKDALKAEEANAQQLSAALAELAAQDHSQAVAAATAVRDAARGALDAAETAVEAATRELAGAEAGDGRDESNRSLKERLADAHNDQTASDAAAKQAQLTAKHLSQQLASQRKVLAAKSKASDGLEAELAKAVALAAEGQARLQALAFNAEEMQQLEAARDAANLDVRRCQEEVARLSQQVANCSFHYSDPHPNFDRRKVHGVVARLVHVKDPSTSVALEVAAGGRLFQVVVDDELTAKEVLDKGKLNKRVTIIPLNKVQHYTPSNSVLAAAQRLGEGKAQPAIELVGCSSSVSNAIKYTFGGTFICKDASTAKKLAFSREVNSRCVSLEGDDFNPSGILTGGSRNTTNPVLSRLHDLAAAEHALGQHQQAFSQAEAGLRAMAGAAKEHRKLQQEVELQAHSLALLRERIAGSESAQLAAEVETLGVQLAEAEAAAAAAVAKKQELVQLAQSLEREIRDFDKERGSRLKAANAKLAKSKSQVEACKKELKAAEAGAAAAAAELDAAGGEAAQVQAAVAASAEAIKGLSAEVATLQARMEASQAEFASTEARLKELRQRLGECDREISKLEKQKAVAMRAVADADAEADSAKTKLVQAQKLLAAMEKYLKDCEEKYPLVMAEKASFGRGDYDFEGQDINVAKKQHEELREQLEGHRGKRQQKAAEWLQSAEKQYQSLSEKRAIVEQDRCKIEKVIVELDDKKREALATTWNKVNGFFGNIFRTLLPGSGAKLEPPEGCTYESGLEVRVCFGTVWKDSLSELSGGQRSLLALSLILALCRFKPAPLYILDEVDAALDLNHTQNIGTMIKEEFPESQFIIVSLKEGLFNNANVIFHTKFVEGVSQVTRTENAQAKNRSENLGRKAAVGGSQAAKQVLRDSNHA